MTLRHVNEGTPRFYADWTDEADPDFDEGSTSNNTNGVSPLTLTVTDPPTQGEVESKANKFDELVFALWR